MERSSLGRFSWPLTACQQAGHPVNGSRDFPLPRGSPRGQSWPLAPCSLLLSTQIQIQIRYRCEHRKQSRMVSRANYLIKCQLEIE